MSGRTDRVASRLCALALGWSIAVAGALALLPGGTSSTTSVDPSGTVRTTVARTSLLDSEGPGVLLVLMAPTVACGAALFAGGHRRPTRGIRTALAAVLLAACVAASLSIGLFFVPAAVALAVAAAKTGR